MHTARNFKKGEIMAYEDFVYNSSYKKLREELDLAKENLKKAKAKVNERIDALFEYERKQINLWDKYRAVKEMDEFLWKNFYPEWNKGYTPPEEPNLWLLGFHSDAVYILMDPGLNDKVDAQAEIERYLDSYRGLIVGDLREFVGWDKILEEAELRINIEDALRASRNGSDLSGRLGYCFYRFDCDRLYELHKSGKYRKKIEDLLEDCNYHWLSGPLIRNDYEGTARAIEEEYK